MAQPLEHAARKPPEAANVGDETVQVESDRNPAIKLARQKIGKDAEPIEQIKTEENASAKRDSALAQRIADEETKKAKQSAKDAALAKQLQNSAGPVRTTAGHAFVIPKINLRKNDGGGDCLFHAIAGTSIHKNLSEEKILDLRKKIAVVLCKQNDKDKQELEELKKQKNADSDAIDEIEDRITRRLKRNYHAYYMISLTKDLPALGDTEILDNEKLAKIIEESGTYADDMEIELWLKLQKNEEMSVIVIDGQSDSESIISFRYNNTEDEVVRIARQLKSQVPPWSEEVARREIKASIADALAEETQERNSGVPITRNHLALYRTFKHWEAIINYE